jgi:hypothetical protein
VQFPTFSQSWNRYSYVNNTPTSFTDPTGYFGNDTMQEIEVREPMPRSTFNHSAFRTLGSFGVSNGGGVGSGGGLAAGGFGEGATAPSETELAEADDLEDGCPIPTESCRPSSDGIDAQEGAAPGSGGKSRSLTPLSFFRGVLKRIWALPNTIIGLAYGGIGMIFGAKPVWDSSAGILRFTNMPRWMMPSALSLGHVQVFGKGYYQNQDGTDAVNRFSVPVVTEETLHTRQAEVLGPLYLPLQGLSMGVSLLTGGGTHDNNLLEMGPERNNGPWPWN